jgi:hypothetical protein
MSNKGNHQPNTKKEKGRWKIYKELNSTSMINILVSLSNMYYHESFSSIRNCYLFQIGVTAVRDH